MARKASENKTGVTEKEAAAKVLSTTESDQGIKAAATFEHAGTAGVDKEAEGESTGSQAGSTQVTQESQTGGVFPFNVSAGGFVEVISEKRAGKSVVGATGDIVTFDDFGHAKARAEDALHFSQVPGFSFK